MTKRTIQFYRIKCVLWYVSSKDLTTNMCFFFDSMCFARTALDCGLIRKRPVLSAELL